jgi:hypothetical protein
MVESSTRTDRLEYLYHQYIEPVRARFTAIFDQLRDQGRIKSMPYDVFYFLLTSGGTAPFGQIGLVSLMNPEMVTPDQADARVYAENVAEILLSGLSLPG